MLSLFLQIFLTVLKFDLYFFNAFIALLILFLGSWHSIEFYFTIAMTSLSLLVVPLSANIVRNERRSAIPILFVRKLDFHHFPTRSY